MTLEYQTDHSPLGEHEEEAIAGVSLATRVILACAAVIILAFAVLAFLKTGDHNTKHSDVAYIITGLIALVVSGGLSTIAAKGTGLLKR